MAVLRGFGMRFGMHRAGALGAGLLMALLPVVAAAQVEGRALETPESAMRVVVITLGAVGALFLVGALGWLYQQHRGLHWAFQDPDPVVEHH